MTNKNSKDLLTVSEVAEALNLTPQAIRYRISKLKLQTNTQNGVLVIDKAQFKQIKEYGSVDNSNDYYNKDKSETEKDKYVDELIVAQRDEIGHLRERVIELSTQNKRLMDLLEHEQELRAREQQVLLEHKASQSGFLRKLFGR
ncbi:hypothetical protein [Globicatella sanguinis]